MDCQSKRNQWHKALHRKLQYHNALSVMRFVILQIDAGAVVWAFAPEGVSELKRKIVRPAKMQS